MTDFSPHRFTLPKSVNVTLTELADAHYGGNRSRAVRASISEHAYHKENDIRLEDLSPRLENIESKCDDIHALLNDTASNPEASTPSTGTPTPVKSNTIDDVAIDLFDKISDSHTGGFHIHTLLRDDCKRPWRLHRALGILLKDGLITVSADSAPAVYKIKGEPI